MKLFNILFALALMAVVSFSVSTSANAQIIDKDTEFVKVTSGYQFTEGPYWHPDGYLLFSDIPANTIYKWVPGSEATVFMKPSGHSNGITSTPEGDLVLAQHDGMISLINSDHKVQVLAKEYEGKRLNSPNDVTVASDGTIYFTDPPFGVSEENKELEFSGVYILKQGGSPQLMYDGFEQPNGVVLTRDESKVYFNDTATGQIMVFERNKSGKLIDGNKFANVGPSEDSGAADGMAVDRNGNVYSTGPGGIYIFNSEGEQIQFVETPARITNMEWGRDDLQTLFITTPAAIYSIKTNATGVKK